MGLDDVALKLFDQLPELNLAVLNLMLNGFLELGKIEGNYLGCTAEWNGRVSSPLYLVFVI
ncbi:hypothetical protein CRYUN_Cryun21dG0066800 [Craigia yunnanensis]